MYLRVTKRRLGHRDSERIITASKLTLLQIICTAQSLLRRLRYGQTAAAEVGDTERSSHQTHHGNVATIMLDLLRKYQRQGIMPPLDRFCIEVKETCKVPGQSGPLQQRIVLLESLLAESTINQALRERRGAGSCRDVSAWKPSSRRSHRPTAIEF